MNFFFLNNLSIIIMMCSYVFSFFTHFDNSTMKFIEMFRKYFFEIDNEFSSFCFAFR